MSSLAVVDPRAHALARIAKSYGMQNALRIVVEARRVDLAISLAFAVVEQETGTGVNVWGHDPAPNGHTTDLGGRLVTPATYRAYLAVRGPAGRGGMQGVGPMQLTWWSTQDAADRLGGCWVPKHNIRVGLTALSGLVHANGARDGIRRYNGGGTAAENYAIKVLERQAKWHGRLARA